MHSPCWRTDAVANAMVVAMPPRQSLPVLLTVLAVLALSVGYAGWVWQVGQTMGIVVPLGEDGPIWLDSARLASTGQAVGQPPVYPWLLVLVGLGTPSVSAALLLNAGLVALGLLGAAAGGALMAGGAWSRCVAALCAPLVVLVAADPAGYAWFVHPETLISAILVWVGVASVLVMKHPGRWTAVALGVICGIALGAKEHGLVTFVLAPVVLWLASATGRRERLLWWLLALSPFLVIQVFNGALVSKAWEMVAESMGWLGQTPDSIAVLPIQMTDQQQQQVRDGNLLGMLIQQVFSASRPWWAAYGGALVMAGMLVRANKWRLVCALGLPMMTLAPALVLWTEPRHYLVVAPAAAVLVVAGAGSFVRGGRGALGLLAGCLLAMVVLAPGANARLRDTLQESVDTQTAHRDEYQALMWLNANLDLADRVLVEVDPIVLGKIPFMPIPRGQPLQPETLPADAYMVTHREVGAPWMRMETTGALHIYKLQR